MNEAGAPVDLLDQTEALYRDAAEELAQALQGVRRGDISEAKAAVQAVKDLRTAFHCSRCPGFSNSGRWIISFRPKGIGSPG
ncbi:hypothetical protein BMI87_09300 [Thioclava sp. F28-4]|nr:hypothetical protein BMI87_09300 [Thioclava sp. F28-4]